MAEGQGNITYGGKTAAGGGGGGVAILAANNGLSLKADGIGFDVVLGNDLGDATNPAILLNDRAIPMHDFQLRFLLNEPDPAFLAFNHPEGPVFYDFEGSVDTGTRWETYWPSNFGTDYTPFGFGAGFGNGVATFPGVNEPVTPRPNVVGLVWGYNTEFTGGVLDPSEAAFRLGTETFFCIGTDPHFEFHLPEITTQGPVGAQTFRLDSTYVSRSSGLGFRELIINDFSIFDTGHSAISGQFYIDFEYNAASDQTRQIVFSQNTGGLSEILLGNWVDGTMTIAFSGGLSNITAPGQLELDGLFLLFTSPNNICNFCPGTAISDIGVVAHDPVAVLDVSSNSKGMYVPRLTTVERLAISLAGALTGGLMVYDTDIQKFFVTCGNVPTVAWQQVTSV
jgi:hypothetical protein